MHKKMMLSNTSKPKSIAPVVTSHRKKISGQMLLSSFLNLFLMVALILGQVLITDITTASAAPLPESDTSGQLLVRFLPNSKASQRDALLKQHGASKKKEIPGLHVVVLDVPPQARLKVLSALQKSPLVEFAELNYVASMQDTITDDPEFNQQWGLQAIGAPAAWDVQTGGTNVTIAIIDTGVDLDHPDLQNKIIPGWDVINNDSDPQDDNGHGTHVAGITAASTNNATGIAGVAWDAQILPVKVLNSSGSGSYADVAEGIIYAVDHGANVINLSLGGTAPSTTLEEAINYANNHGVIIVAAAGNLGSSGVIYPARYTNTIAVAAIDSNYDLASFSSQGSEVDLAAPGVDIYSTYLNDGFMSMNGTSMAAPFVSGAAALLLSSGIFNTPAEVRTALEITSLDLGNPGLDNFFGYGLLQIDDALNYDGTVIVPTGTVTSSPTSTGEPSPTATHTPTPGTITPEPTWTPDPNDIPGPEEPSIQLEEANGVILSYIWKSTGIYFFITNPDDSERRFVFREESDSVPLGLVRLSPVATHVAYVVAHDQEGFLDASILIRDLVSNSVVVQIDAGEDYFNVDPRWSPDGANLAFARGYPNRPGNVRAELWMVDVMSAQTLRLIADESFGPAFFFGESYAITWTSDGERIQYYDEIGLEQVFEVDVDTGMATIAQQAEVLPQIANYIAKIASAHSEATSTMNRPIAGLANYVGQTNNTFSTVHLGNYSSGSEGTGVHPGVDVKNVTCQETQVLSVAGGEIWGDGTRNWGPQGSTPCGNNTRFGVNAGNYVIVRHDISLQGGYSGAVYSIYQHLSSVTACSNCSIPAGTVIGMVGSTGYSTGPHLHFQMDYASAQFHPYYRCNTNCDNTALIDDMRNNTVNPLMFIQAHESTVGVTLYDPAYYGPPNSSFVYETMRVNDPYLYENPIGDNRISSARIPPGWVLIVYPEAGFRGTPREYTSDVANFGDLDNQISSVKIGYLMCPAGTLAEEETPRIGIESCIPNTPPTPTPPPTSPPGVTDGLRLISVSSPTVQKNQTFNVSVTYEIVSGSLLQSRGDHLHATPEDNSNAFGAWPVVGVNGSHYAGEQYTFSFNLTAPNQTGNFSSRWRVRVGGNHIGPEAVINFTVQDQPPAPAGGIYVCTDINKGGSCYGPLTGDYSSVNPINDQIESVWRQGCWQAVLYKDSEFSNDHMYTMGTDDLGSEWRNQTSSIRVNSCDNAAFTLYNLGDLNGESWSVDRTVLDLGHWNHNDWAQSMRINSGFGIVACEHDNFHGRCGRATGPREFRDINELAQGLRNGVSSIRVCNGACPPPPNAPGIIYPTMGGHAPSNQDTILQWSGDGSQYYAELWGGGITGTRQFGWSNDSQWNVGQLPVSSQPYNWRVRGWNGYGEGDWTSGSFYIKAPTIEALGVFTTDELGPASISSDKEPQLDEDLVNVSTSKTAFNTGDPIQLYLGISNDFPVDTLATLEWLVIDPAGREVGELSWAGDLYISPGENWWYLDSIIPSNALTGDYTFIGSVTYNGQTTSYDTSFHVSGVSAVVAAGVYTTDENGTANAAGEGPYLDSLEIDASAYKTAFNLGDPIRLYIDTYNSFAVETVATIEWQVMDPAGRTMPSLSYSGDLASPAGRSGWYLSSMIPADALAGEYTFVGSLTYDGQTTSYSTSFDVTGVTTILATDVFTTDENGTVTGAAAGPRVATEDVNASAYKTAFNAGEPIRLYLGTFSNVPDPTTATLIFEVTDPTGQVVSDLSYEGDLSISTGGTLWYLSSMIPVDALTGEYEFVGAVVYDGQTTGLSTSFMVTGSPTVEVLSVFTTDENGTASVASENPQKTTRQASTTAIKTSFDRGEPIQLYIDTYNNIPPEATAYFEWYVTDPTGQAVPQLSWSGDLTTPVGWTWWYLSSAMPTDAITGDYTFTGSITYNGSTSSQSTSFSVPGPGTFNKLSPVNGTLNTPTSLTLDWGNSSEMTNYEYCLDTTNDDACSTSWINNTADQSIVLTGLTSSTTYYWQVRASNDHGLTYADGSPTTFWSFTTGATPPAFNKANPGDGAANRSTSMGLYWYNSLGAASYDYCYDTTNDGLCSNWVNTGLVRNVMLSGLTPSTTYYWQVRSNNAYGSTYANADTFWSFTTASLPGGFGKSGPLDGVTIAGDAVLTWEASSGAISYDYCYDTTDDGQCINWVNTGTTRSVTLSGLVPGTTYYWQVRANNNMGSTFANESESAFWSFTPSQLAGFNKANPGNGSIGRQTTLTLYWYYSAGATSYEYCYDLSNDGLCSNWVSTGLTRNVTLSGLTPNKTYYWQVRSNNGYGSVYANGTANAFWSFTTGSLPGSFNKSSPTNGVAVTSDPVLTWGASSGATSYEYCYDTTNDNACSNWVNTGLVRTVTLNGLNPSTTYYWQVRANNSIGTIYSNGTQTAIWSLTTSQPGGFNKANPGNSAINRATTLTLYWYGSSGATTYEYCYDTSNDGQCSNWVNTGLTRNATLSGLDPNTTYYWQVRANNVFGSVYANAATFWSFRTVSNLAQ